MNDLPFVQTENIRRFKGGLTEEVLQWHFDDEDREIAPLHETTWKFQLDNQLPQNLSPTSSIFVPAKTYHRLISGAEDLALKVTFL